MRLFELAFEKCSEGTKVQLQSSCQGITFWIPSMDPVSWQIFLLAFVLSNTPALWHFKSGSSQGGVRGEAGKMIHQQKNAAGQSFNMNHFHLPVWHLALNSPVEHSQPCWDLPRAAAGSAEPRNNGCVLCQLLPLLL